MQDAIMRTGLELMICTGPLTNPAFSVFAFNTTMTRESKVPIGTMNVRRGGDD
jgi:hypothetical protein